MADRHCIAARQFGPHKSLIFVFTVAVERDDETGLFEATVNGMEQSIGATAENLLDAARRAVRCFECLVDDAIRRRVGLKEALKSESVKVLQAQLSLQDVAQLMGRMGGDAGPVPEAEGMDWRFLERSPITSQLEPELV